MLSFFSPIDAAAHREQVQRLADQLKDNPLPRAATPPPKRSVGRPRLKRSAEAELFDAAAAEAVIEQLPQLKRGKYTRWFDSPYLHDIIAAHARCGGSARRTVLTLQKNDPDGRFERLSHSTVASWFDEKGTLKEQYQRELDAGRAAATYVGPCAVLQASAPGAEAEICDILLQMRHAGTPLNSHIIRWVMLAVLQRKHPAVLEKLTLSQTYISAWVRRNPRLLFRWRARTTAASKVPLDWEAQGICMAQRMAAAIQLHDVSNSYSSHKSTHPPVTLLRIPDIVVSFVFVLRFTHPLLSTWIRLEYTSCLLHRGRMKQWAALTLLLWARKTSDRSPPA